MQLNDPTLFRQQALIDGNWRDANSGETIAVTNPANGQQLGSVPKTPRRYRRRQPRSARLACADRQRAGQHPAPLVQPDD